MKILFVLHDAELYGASRSVLDLANALRYRKQDCVFLLPGQGPMAQLLKDSGFEFHIAEYENWAVYKAFLYSNPNVSSNRALRLVKLFKFFWRHAKEARRVKKEIGKVDWVYSNSSLVIFGFILSKVMGVKHAWQLREFIGDGKDYVYLFSSSIRKLIYRYNTRFIFSSNSLKEYYAAETNNRGTGVHDPVDHLPVEHKVQSSNLNTGFVFGMLGSVNENKGQFEMVKYFAALVKRYNNLRLFIGGEGETKEILDFISANNLHQQIILQEQIGTRAFFEQVDYVIVNSKYEGFGRVAIEAMKNRKLVIGRKSTGTFEVIGNNERGLLFENEQELSRIVADILSEKIETKRILDTAYYWAQKNTTPIDVADKVLEVLEPGFKPEGTTSVFDAIYRQNNWGEIESISGPGSTMEQTAIIRKELPVLFQKWSVKTVLDIPCGDLNWMKYVDLGKVHYTGADIVSNLIVENGKRYGNENRDFKVLDLMNDKLPPTDLLFCRDCLVHFSYADINKAIANIKRSGIKYLLVTTFSERAGNEDIQTGNWRPLNLQVAPFNFPKPLQLINEGCTENDGIYADKCLALWDLNTIIIA